MKPSSRDHQLGLASQLNYMANQSGNIKSPSKKEAGLDVSHQALVSREGRGENFFLDIPFHRMSVMAIYDGSTWQEFPLSLIVLPVSFVEEPAVMTKR